MIGVDALVVIAVEDGGIFGDDLLGGLERVMEGGRGLKVDSYKGSSERKEFRVQGSSVGDLGGVTPAKATKRWNFRGNAEFMMVEHLSASVPQGYSSRTVDLFFAESLTVAPTWYMRSQKLCHPHPLLSVTRKSRTITYLPKTHHLQLLKKAKYPYELLLLRLAPKQHRVELLLQVR